MQSAIAGVRVEDSVTAWTFWKDEPPPRTSFVVAKYEFSGPEELVKTCRRGCCVNAGFGPMRLPKFWRAPTDLEIDAGRETIENGVDYLPD